MRAHRGIRALALLALGGLLAVGFAASALADVFDIKDTDFRKGEREIELNLAFQRGFPVNAERVRSSAELAIKYGITEWWKFELTAELDEPEGQDLRFSTVGIENTFALRKLESGIGLGWFTGVDFAVHRDETNTVTFGPILQFGSDKASITLNPLFEKTFGQNREEGVAFVYAWQAKAEVREHVAVGIEGYGVIPDIGNAPGIDFQEHRIGPVLYLDFDLDRNGKPEKRLSLKDTGRHGRAGEQEGHDEEGPKLALELGVLFGLTEATPDTTVKFKAAASF